MTVETAREVDAFGLTDTGRVRTNNEDHFVIATLRKSVALDYTSLEQPGPFDALQQGTTARLFIVADGVGGRPGGELASGTAVETLLHFISRTVGCFHAVDVEKENAFLISLDLAVQAAHFRIQEELGAGGHSPSTTLTMAALIGRRAYLVHVGDSRAYYLHGGRLRQLTDDQTMGRFMVDAGAWTEEQAARAGVAANLTSAIGGSEMTPRVGLVDLAPGDALLLCTDGLTKHVSDDQMRDVMLEGSGAEAATRKLVSLALDAGGSDNVTVIVVKL